MKTNYLLAAALSILVVSCSDNNPETVPTEQKPDSITKIRQRDTLSDATIAH